ncbi:PhzF family phenazine biosynthesis protein [Flavihumibacter rivuli]|uniref:PhzF family phenazine biosynthesis protein n=1 Tax=Flavihumibacter rivuli TaxID=2838156 RepID=UPI001BDE3DFE|nr:PhzF family phenazine biosynthesis protein [Flavihumibacter rivuli]ULQ56900.1 PhzF family phenazine biosynthesis protein [Flavihumibacter rivuli]
MELNIYVADAFVDKPFSGNPAAVILLREWLSEPLMQQIAMENNLSETAYLVKEGEHYRIRWFTPGVEVNLCGHATLAASHILFEELGIEGDTLLFTSKSGELKVSRSAEGLTLDFPSNPPEMIGVPAGLFEGLRISEGLVFKTSFDYMVLLGSQKEVEALDPDFTSLAGFGGRGIICTAKGDEADFVSRCFYPQSGINEDPVTGSAHTIMVPFWAAQLNKTSLQAKQLSQRGGSLSCALKGDRVLMTGKARTYLKGTIFIE